jgi:hypothetical protein
MLLMKRRFANVLANTTMNSSGNLDTYNLFALSMMMTFRASNPEYKGSRYNVLIEWENGEITSEPLNIFGKDDPVTCAVYAHEHGLLEEEGWKEFKGIAKREKKMLRMVNQSCIKMTRNAPRYKFGYRIPRNYDEAMQFDLKNGNTLWQEVTGLEMLQLEQFCIRVFFSFGLSVCFDNELSSFVCR